MIITVTGPRDWPDKQQVFDELDRLFRQHILDHRPHDDPGLNAAFILRHGVNPSGVDAFANEWGLERGVTIERFRADWQLPNGGIDYSAGPRRNAVMARATPRADLCLAFWDGKLTRRGNREVSGTLNMIQEALQAGLPVQIKPLRRPEP